MILDGTVVSGKIVLDNPQALPDGTKVRVEVRPPAVDQQEWLRRLRSAATDCGVSLSNEALSSDGLYD